MIDRYIQVISICTLGSVYRAFLNTYYVHRHSNVRLYDTIILDEASHAAKRYFFILFHQIDLRQLIVTSSFYSIRSIIVYQIKT